MEVKRHAVLTTAWAHLPNAQYVDHVLAHVGLHPERWSAARDATWDAAWDTARDAARDAAWDAVRDATLALVAYDDCAHFLTQPAESVRLAARMGIPAAVLLLPACIALKDKT